jgi:GAF domain-containing protein
VLTEPTSAHSTPIELLQLLAQAPDLDVFLDRLVRLAARAVPAAVACGVTLRRNGQAFTVASSDTFAAQIDELQYEAGEGPCLEAFRTGTTVQVDDLAAERRWDRFRPSALAHGMISSLSLPLAIDGQVAAALNLYGKSPGAFSPADADTARALAAQSTAALEVILHQTDQALLREQLDTALRSRAVIDQALGILMAQQRCTAREAFDLLRQASQHRNRKLREVAVDIVTAVTGRPPEPPSFDGPPLRLL